MAKRTTRDMYKRKLDTIPGHIDTINNTLSEFASVYNDSEPLLAAQALMLIEANLALLSALDSLMEDF